MLMCMCMCIISRTLAAGTWSPLVATNLDSDCCEYDLSMLTGSLLLSILIVIQSLLLPPPFLITLLALAPAILSVIVGYTSSSSDS